MLTVGCFKWKPFNGYRSVFGPEAVNTLFRMVDRHYRDPHRNVCVTDDATGLDPSIEVVPLWDDYAQVPSPHGGHNPSCYRRLKAFAPEAEQWFGPRFVFVDLDTVIVNDMRPIWNRKEDFVIWGETDRRSWYNGSMWMMTAGARKQVWEQFDPDTSPKIAKNAGRFGSDQGWISYILGPGEAMWGRGDGVYSYRVHVRNRHKLPGNARIVMFHGHEDPWSPKPQKLPWVRRHWC